MFSVRLKLLFVTLFIAVNCVSADHYKTVETLNGLVRGVQNKTLLKGVSFYAFKGIPYAKPPIGDLRFKVKMDDYLQIIVHFVSISCYFHIKNY